MNATPTLSSDPVLRNLDALLPDLETLYKDVHAHPELSMEEMRTAGLAAVRAVIQVERERLQPGRVQAQLAHDMLHDDEHRPAVDSAREADADRLGFRDILQPV